MTFDKLHPDAQYLDQHNFEGSFILKGKETGLCWHCGKETTWLDSIFGTWLCSEECNRAKWAEYFDDMKSGRAHLCQAHTYKHGLVA